MKKLKGAPEASFEAAPPSAGEGDDKTRASPTRSSSRVLAGLAGASSIPMAQATPEASVPDATAAVIGTQKVLTLVL